MKAYLIRSSLLLLFSLTNFSFFAQEKKTPCTQIHIPDFESVKYRATIDVMNKHLSGILIFKTMSDSGTHAVFMNEMGVTYFDILFNENNYAYQSIMESFDKKAVRITLAKDLGMVLIKGIFKSQNNISKVENQLILKLKRKGKVIYHTNQNCLQYSSIENFGRRKKIVSIQQTYQGNQQMPDSIFVHHQTFNFSISLKQIHVTE